MATIEEVYQLVIANDEEKAAFAEAAQTPEGLSAFLVARGCEASAEEVAEFLRSRQGELADEELDSVAGGCSKSEATLSVLSVGLGCALLATYSGVKGEMRGDHGQILCATTSQ